MGGKGRREWKREFDKVAFNSKSLSTRDSEEEQKLEDILVKDGVLYCLCMNYDVCYLNFLRLSNMKKERPMVLLGCDLSVN